MNTPSYPRKTSKLSFLWKTEALSGLPSGEYASLGGCAEGSVRVANDSQIDSNLSLVNFARALIAAFGFTAFIGAVASENGPRARLQCTLSAASCLLTSVYYTKMTNLRMTPGSGYSRQVNASVDSLRFSSWAVCNALQSWLALVVRGPFEGGRTFMTYSYNEWFRLASFLCSSGVILGGAALFCVESARMASISYRARLEWAACGVVALLCAITCATVTSLALNQPADLKERDQHEIDIGFAISSFWILYPLMGGVRVMLSAFVQHHATDALNVELGEENAAPFLGVLREIRNALIWGFRALNASHDYRRIDMDSSFGIPLVPPLYMGILDTILAAVDVVVIAMPALAVTSLAFKY